MASYISGTPSPSVPVSWSESLNAQTTSVKKAHLAELRASLEALDGHIHVFNGNNSGAELPNVSVTWAEPTASIVVNTTPVKASHVNEVITYLKAFVGHKHNVPAYSADSTLFSPSLSFIDDPVVSLVTGIKAAAWNELRAHMETYSTHTHTVCCECECECTCTCTCQCQCTEDCCSQCDCCD
jgi:hypothetical protein